MDFVNEDEGEQADAPENEPKAAPTIEEIQQHGVLYYSNSYSSVYLLNNRYFRNANGTWSEVTKCRSRFFFKQYLDGTSHEPTPAASFLDLALAYVPELAGGKVVEKFKSSGGIIKVGEKFFRVSYLHGMQEVREGFERWKTVSNVYESEALKQKIKTVRAHQEESHV